MSTFGRYVVAIVLGTSLLAPAGASQSSTILDCAALPGVTPNVWQGLGVDPDADDQWENDANWSLGIAPLRLSDPYVCIPTGGTPVIGAGQEAQLVALDVAADAELTVDAGGKLFLYGGASTPSTIRGRVEVIGATIGGPGRVEVTGALHVRSLGPSGPANITTRECALFAGPYRLGEEPCVPGLPIIGATGRIVVDDEGVVDVSGGRVNLADEFEITVHGLLRVHDDGFLAADHGTRLELLPHSAATPGTGTLRFEDDGDYVEGSNDSGISELGTVVNQGLISKSGGNGTSLLTGTYTQPSPGAVTVGSGTLLLPSGSMTPASVAAGAGYGSGRCLAPEPGCLAQTFGADRQNVQLQVPTEDSTGASVLIRELSTASSALDIGYPVEAHATGLSATAEAPAILSFRYDERVLNGRDWTSIDVFRRASDGAPYVALQACLANGDQPRGQVACVDRRGLAGSSRNVVDEEGPGSAPDVIMVVRTVGTSRWVAR